MNGDKIGVYLPIDYRSGGINSYYNIAFQIYDCHEQLP